MIMKIVLDVQEKKVPFIMELLKNFKFVKVESKPSPYKQEVMDNIKQGFEEVKLIEQGKIAGRPIEELLKELS